MSAREYEHNIRDKTKMKQREQSSNIEIKERVGKGEGNSHPHELTVIGGYGTVYRATTGEADFILKKMNRTPSRSTEEIARREYKTGMRLKHPNLVRMRGTFDTTTDHCLVMDVVEGCNLFDFLQDQSFGHFSENRARKMFKGLAKGDHITSSHNHSQLLIQDSNTVTNKASPTWTSSQRTSW